MKDWRGVEIHPGTRIVYPVAGSSWINLIEATVEKINDDYLIVRPLYEKSHGPTRVTPKPTTRKVTRIDRVTVVI